MPFTIILDDPAGNSFIQNFLSPAPDPQLILRNYTRTPDQDRSLGNSMFQNRKGIVVCLQYFVFRCFSLTLGLQSETAAYRDDADSNLRALIPGSGKAVFGMAKAEE